MSASGHQQAGGPCPCNCGCEPDGDWHFSEPAGCRCASLGCDCVTDAPGRPAIRAQASAEFIPAAQYHEDVDHILGEYVPSDEDTWSKVDSNYDWEHPRLKAMVGDIRRNGVRRPVPIDYEQDPPQVMNGHTRVLAAKRAGQRTVPTRQHAGFADPDDPDPSGYQPYDPQHWTQHPDHQEELRQEFGPKTAAQVQAGSYSMQHTAPNPAAGHRSLDHYTGGGPSDHVRIYRAAPRGTESINTGDWVSLNPGYAHQHGRHATDPGKDWPVYAASVPQRHVHWDENDENEHGYNGPSIPRPDVHDEETGELHDWDEYHEAHPHGREAWTGASVHLSPEDHALVHDEFESEDDRANTILDAARRQGSLRSARWQDDNFPARDDAEAHAAARHADAPAGHRTTAFTVHRDDEGRVADLDIHHYEPSADPHEHRRYQGIDDLTSWNYKHPEVDKVGTAREATAGVDDYAMRHRPGSEEYGAPLHDVEDMMPGYHDRKPSLYDNHHLAREPWVSHESDEQIRRARGNPEADVNIYRALPREHRDINPGDWVSTSANYARQHAESNLHDQPWAVLRSTVKAKHLFTEGDMNEWGYHGPAISGAKVHVHGGPRKKTAAVVAHFEAEAAAGPDVTVSHEELDQSGGGTVAALVNPHNDEGQRADPRFWAEQDTPETWYHGSPYAYHRMDSDHAAHQEALYDEGEGSSTHWNNLLGGHWAGHEGTAAGFVGESSSGNHEGPGGYIYHARLHIRNPKHYASEFDMDKEAYSHEFEAGNHPVNHDSLFEEEHEGDPNLGHHDDLRSQEDFPAHRFPDGHTGQLDNRGRYMRWLSQHPDKEGIAARFKGRLQGQGHDGITYGNELEKNNGGNGGTCAINFRPDQVQITQRHEYDPRKDDEYYEHGSPFNCHQGEEAARQERYWPHPDQPELPFGEHQAAVAAHFEDDPGEGMSHVAARGPDEENEEQWNPAWGVRPDAQCPKCGHVAGEEPRAEMLNLNVGGEHPAPSYLARCGNCEHVWSAHKSGEQERADREAAQMGHAEYERNRVAGGELFSHFTEHPTHPFPGWGQGPDLMRQVERAEYQMPPAGLPLPAQRDTPMNRRIREHRFQRVLNDPGASRPVELHPQGGDITRMSAAHTAVVAHFEDGEDPGEELREEGLQAPSEHGVDSDTAHSRRYLPYAGPPSGDEELRAHVTGVHGVSPELIRDFPEENLSGMHDTAHALARENHQHELPEGHDPVFGSRQAGALVAHFSDDFPFEDPEHERRTPFNEAWNAVERDALYPREQREAPSISIGRRPIEDLPPGGEDFQWREDSPHRDYFRSGGPEGWRRADLNNHLREDHHSPGIEDALLRADAQGRGSSDHYQALDAVHRRAHGRELGEWGSQNHDSPEYWALENGHRPYAEQAEADDRQRQQEDDEDRRRQRVTLHGETANLHEVENHLRSAHGIPEHMMPAFHHTAEDGQYTTPYSSELEELHDQDHGEMGSHRHEEPGEESPRVHGEEMGHEDAYSHLSEHHGHNYDELREEEPDARRLEQYHEDAHDRERGTRWDTHHRNDPWDFSEGRARRVHPLEKDPDDEDEDHRTAALEAGVTAAYDYDADEGPFEWSEIGDRHPHLYGDPEINRKAPSHADGFGIGDAAAHLYYDRPGQPYEETYGGLHPSAGAEGSMLFHPRTVEPSRIDYARSEPGDPRVRQAREGYESQRPERVPPLVLVHRHGVFQVADGHHRAEGAAKASKPVRAYVAYSPHEEEPFSDGERAPYHGASTEEPRAYPDQNGIVRRISYPGFPHTADVPRPQAREASRREEVTLLPVYDAAAAVAAPALPCPRVDAVLEAVALLGAWEPRDGADAALGVIALRQVFEALHGGLARVSAVIGEMPVHGDVAEGLHQMAMTARTAAEDAGRTAPAPPTEASWEEPPASPNR